MQQTTRRIFLMTSLIGGFSLAASRGEAAPIVTSAEGLVAGETKVPVRDGDLPAYFARPAGHGPFPVVLVTEEIFGVHEYIKDVCRRLAHRGYLAVAAEYYARQGDLAAMTDVKQILETVILRTPDAQMMNDMDHVAAWASHHGGNPARLAILGFCRGGRQTWLYAAHNPHLRAAVAFYGPLGGTRTPIQPHTALDEAGHIHCPLLAFYGELDASIPVSERAETAHAAHEAGKRVEMVVYPQAGHGFHADYRPSYNPTAAEDAWRRTLVFLPDNGV